MTYDIYRLIFIVGAISCAVMFVVSVILFITLKIPNVIGDLTLSLIHISEPTRPY